MFILRDLIESLQAEFSKTTQGTVSGAYRRSNLNLFEKQCKKRIHPQLPRFTA